jgi:YVTN family beta-propeller protein
MSARRRNCAALVPAYKEGPIVASLVFSPAAHARALLRTWTLLAIAFSSAAVANDGNSLMDISRDGRLLACANRDSGTVTVVDLDTHAKRAEIPVGKHPEGISFLGESHLLAVAVYADDVVAIVDADAATVTKRVIDGVFDEPYGVVSNREGTRIYVSLDYPGQVIEIDAGSAKIVRTFQAGEFPRGIALAKDQSRLFVTQYYSGAVLAIDLASGSIVDRWPGVSNDNLSRQLTAHPLRNKLYLAHIRSRVTAVHGEGSIFPYVSVVDIAPGEGTRRRRIPMDAVLGNLVTSNPWETAISNDGRQFYVVFAGTDDMFAFDVVDDDYREIALRKYLKLGRNPRAVRVAPDNQRFYVYQALDFSVAAYDATSLEKVATIPVTDNPLAADVLRGKILFYSAAQPMVGRRWISCSSCHPDGDPDGRTWHNPEGLRNTQSLAALKWTHPIHWSADRDEVQDFEHTIRGPLMQGRGLITGMVQAALGTPNKGLSPDLDALAVYTNSHDLPLSPHGKQGLSESARRGKEVFYSKETQCASCHGGAWFSDSTSGKLTRHDVGTGSDDPTEKMGPTYDTPTLLGAYRTAPYLHHGKAATLKDVLTVHNPSNRHGTTSHLSASQVDDLVEFLKALPYEESHPTAGSID